MTYEREVILPIDETDIPGNIAKKESILKRTYDLINLTEEWENVRRNIGESQEKQKERYDKKIGHETELKIRDKVLLKNAAKEKQWSEKLAPKWKGPYYIHEEIGKGAYKLRTLDGKDIDRWEVRMVTEEKWRRKLEEREISDSYKKAKKSR